jgi:hypothetical protein
MRVVMAHIAITIALHYCSWFCSKQYTIPCTLGSHILPAGIPLMLLSNIFCTIKSQPTINIYHYWSSSSFICPFFAVNMCRVLFSRRRRLRLKCRPTYSFSRPSTLESFFPPSSLVSFFSSTLAQLFLQYSVAYSMLTHNIIQNASVVVQTASALDSNYTLPSLLY